MLRAIVYQYDVWECYVNGRTSYRARMVDRTGESKRPDAAVSHLDRVYAPSKRKAISIALGNMRRYRSGWNQWVNATTGEILAQVGN